MGTNWKAWRTRKYKQLDFEFVGDHIVIMYMNNPPVNAHGIQIVHDMDDAWAGIREDNDVRCVILTGDDTTYKGKHYFSAGADIKDWSGRDFGQGLPGFESWVDGKWEFMPREERPMIMPRGSLQVEAIHNSGKVSIAMVNGTCAGAACDFVLACDLSIAADDIIMQWSYILRGIAPFEGGCWLLPRRIGIHKAFDLLTTGRTITAKEADDLGILNKVVPRDQLRDAVMEYAKWYGEKGPPLAIGGTRHMIYTGLEQSFRDHLDSTIFIQGNFKPDRKEAMAAWVEKREPHYEGKGTDR